MEYTIYTDGACRKSNPLSSEGEASIGAVILKDGRVLTEICKYLGTATNNEAEYEAVIQALSELKSLEDINSANVKIMADSELMVRQMKGEYKIKKANIAEKAKKIKDFIAENNLKISFTHIPREQNSEADALANRALDERV